jgi:hypothetical protein
LAGSLIGSVAGGLIGKSASDKAAKTQANSAAQAMAIEQEQLQFAKDSSIFSRASGQNALAKVLDLYGVQRPTDSTIGIEQNLNYTAGRPLPATPAQQVQAQQFQPTQQQQAQPQGIGAQGAPTGGSNLSPYAGLFTPQELFAAQHIPIINVPTTDGKGNRTTEQIVVGSDRLKSIRAVGDTLRQTPEMLNAEAKGQGYFDYRPYSPQQKQQIQSLFKDAAAGKINQNDFYAGKFAQQTTPPVQVAQTPAPIINNQPINQIAQQSPLTAFNAQLNGGQPTAQPQTTQQAQQTIASLLGNMATGQGTAGTGQNSDNIRSELATSLLNGIANSQLNQDNILAGNVTNSLPALFDITRGEQDTTQEFIRNNFETDPGYQFTLAENEKAIKRNMNAKGQLGTGELFKELMKYNTGLAQQSYSDYANRTENALGNLRGQALGQYNNDRNYASNARQSAINDLMLLANVGGAATQQLNQTSGNTAANIANTITSGGAAQGQQIIGGANAITNAINEGVTSIFGNNNKSNNFSLSSLFGGNKPVSLTPNQGFSLSSLFGGNGTTSKRTIGSDGNLLGGVY